MAWYGLVGVVTAITSTSIPYRIGEGVGDRSRRRESVKILDRFGFGLDFLVLLVLESKV